MGSGNAKVDPADVHARFSEYVKNSFWFPRAAPRRSVGSQQEDEERPLPVHLACVVTCASVCSSSIYAA